MTIELPDSVERELRGLAEVQGRDVGAPLEEAVRRYLEMIAITDLDDGQIAESQLALLGELGSLHGWGPRRQ
jgi:predicted transcriptional regulator